MSFARSKAAAAPYCRDSAPSANASFTVQRCCNASCGYGARSGLAMRVARRHFARPVIAGFRGDRHRPARRRQVGGEGGARQYKSRHEQLAHSRSRRLMTDGLDIVRHRRFEHNQCILAGESLRCRRRAEGLDTLIAGSRPLPFQTRCRGPTARFETVIAGIILRRTGLPVIVVNPAQVRAFAQAVGKRSKTDADRCGGRRHACRMRPSSKHAAA